MPMTNVTESTAAAARGGVEPGNTDPEQSDDMGSEGGPEMKDDGTQHELAEENAAAKLDDFA